MLRSLSENAPFCHNILYIPFQMNHKIQNRCVTSVCKLKNRRHRCACGNGRRPLGLVACGLLPQHTERGTVLQTATRSVNNVKFHNHKIKLHFPLRCNEKGEERWLKTYHTYLCPIYKQAMPREKVLFWTRSRAIQMISMISTRRFNI